MIARVLVIAAFATLGGCAALHPKAEEAAAPVTAATCGPRDITVYFDGQSIELSPDARAVIDTTTGGLRGCRINHVRIVGATDVIGAETTNEEVSKQRAKVLADYLVDSAGWSRDAMELLAAGERGAVTDEGLNVPMRRRARIVVDAVAP